MVINTIFSGGGIKGLAYVGALRFLETRGIYINKAGGSSVGALFAALVVAGYSSFELMEIINEFNVDLLVDNKSPLLSLFKIKDIFSNKGVFSIQNFEVFVESLLEKKGIKTFKDVKVGNSYLLKIIVTEVKQTKMVIIPDDLSSYNIDPDSFSIAKAVAMSCNIPFFYHPYQINEYIFVDGGVSDNYPIWLFDDDHHKTLGFRLLADKSEKKQWLSSITNVGKIIKDKIFVTKNSPDFYNRTVYIMVNDIKMIDFKKGINQKRSLYKIGYNCTKDFFYQKK